MSLPGIYGPGRSVLDRLRGGRARRFDAPEHAFSRIHVDDIAGALVASLHGPPGTYNIADDRPGPPAEVTAFGAALLGVEPPPLEPLDLASMSPMAAGFWSGEPAGGERPGQAPAGLATASSGLSQRPAGGAGGRGSGRKCRGREPFVLSLSKHAALRQVTTGFK